MPPRAPWWPSKPGRACQAIIENGFGIDTHGRAVVSR